MRERMDTGQGIGRERGTSMVQGATISLHDVCYAVQVKKQGAACATLSKEILTNIKYVMRAYT